MSEFSSLIFWCNFIIILNGILGLAIFEFVWFKTRRFRKPIKELELQLPECKRDDGKKWVKWKHLTGAVTLLIPRFLAVASIILGSAFVINILMIGHVEGQPIKGWKKYIIRGLCKF